MYHAEREIRDKDIIKAILDMCDIICVGFFDDEYPYVLPFNYGYEYNNNLEFYLHHAVEGYKNSLIEKNPNVCVTAYKFLDRTYNDHDKSGHDYRSVMAFGKIEFIDPKSPDYKKAWETFCKCNGREVPDVVYTPDFKVLMSKITCHPEKVIGKAQRPIHSVEEVPIKMVTFPDA